MVPGYNLRVKKLIASFFILGIAFLRPLGAAEPDPPRLVVMIVVDGLPSRHLENHTEKFSEGGFRFLMTQGAQLTEARYGFANTCTASGHATLITGAQPNRHGIISNIWFDRRLGREVYAVEDAGHEYLGEPMAKRRGTSPKNLKVPALGDALNEQTGKKSRVFAVSMKDRSAILLAGKTGTAYFYSSLTGRFITSHYYAENYPAWLAGYHAKKPQDAWFKKSWDLGFAPETYQDAAITSRYAVDSGIGKKFPHNLEGDKKFPDSKYYSKLSKTPFADEYLLDFTKTLIKEESLGHNPEGAPDLLAVSFSAQDSVNHFFGPESVESLDSLLRLDRMLAELIEFISRETGLESVLFVLTADHGFADSPEHFKSRKLESGRLDSIKILKDLNRHFSKKFGPAEYAVHWSAPTIYFDHALLAKKGIATPEAEKEAVSFFASYPGIAHVFTRGQLDNPYLISDGLERKVWRSWEFETRGDLYLIQNENYYLMDEAHEFASNHATPYDYDARVPLIFFGRWFKASKFKTPADIADVVPTLSQLLNIAPPEGSEGKVIGDILK